MENFVEIQSFENHKKTDTIQKRVIQFQEYYADILVHENISKDDDTRIRLLVSKRTLN